ncbi:hypothetical protein ACUOFC_59995, partial [Escherichia sp. TWPC-MK]
AVNNIACSGPRHSRQPNAVAAGLRAGRTRSIGLVIPDLENTSYTRIANYLERQARQRGYQLLIARSEGSLPSRRSVTSITPCNNAN